MKITQKHIWIVLTVLVAVLTVSIGSVAADAGVSSAADSIDFDGASTVPTATPGGDIKPVPELPALYYGSITIDGQPAPVGTTIVAKIDGIEVGRHTTTVSGRYGYSEDEGNFAVSRYENMSEQSTVNFYVGDSEAMQGPVYQSGKLQNVPLTFYTGAALTPVEFSIKPESVSIDADGSITCTAYVQVQNVGLQAYSGTSTITASVQDYQISFDLTVDDAIPAGEKFTYAVNVLIKDGVGDSQKKTGAGNYSITMDFEPYVEGPLEFNVVLSSDKWQSGEQGKDATISTKVTVRPALSATVQYPVYADATPDEPSYGTFYLHSSGDSITYFELPFKYDPTVARYDSSDAEYLEPGITIKEDGVGYLTINGTGNFSSYTKFSIPLRALGTDNKSCVISNGGKAVTVKAGSTIAKPVTVEQGSFKQAYIPPKVEPSIGAPSSVIDGTPFNITLAFSNPNGIPAYNVTAKLLCGTDVLWETGLNQLQFGPYESQQISVPVTLFADSSSVPKVLRLTAKAENAEREEEATRDVNVETYSLEITDANKDHWESYAGYNRSVFTGNQIDTLGTYFTTNVPGDVTVTIDFHGKEEILFGEFFNPSSLTETTFAKASDMNLFSWWTKSVVLPDHGEYPYTITVERNGVSSSVSGVIIVKQPQVDIKVLESNSFGIDETSGDIQFNVYNRDGSAERSLEIALSAGSAGRTLQGVEYLVGYPHGCPEQSNSPMVALLMMKEYYLSKGIMTDSLNNTVRTNAKKFINNIFSSTRGSNPQQYLDNPSSTRYGGWAWGMPPWNTPSFDYTTLPMYGISLLKEDVKNHPDYWSNVDLHWNEIDLNASADWILDRQSSSGKWDYDVYHGSGEYSDDAAATFYAVQALSTGYDYLDAATQARVDAALTKALQYLDGLHPDYDSTSDHARKAVTYLYINETGIAVDESKVVAEITAALEEAEDYYIDTYTAGMTLFALGYASDMFNKDYFAEFQDSAVKLQGKLINEYHTKGSWYNTYNTGIVIRGLCSASSLPGSLEETVTIQVSLNDNSGNTIYSDNVVLNPSQSAIRLNTVFDDVLSELYGSTEKDLVGTVHIEKPSDISLVVAVTSKDKIPTSAAYRDGGAYDPIPYEHIDPISMDFWMKVDSIEDEIKVGEEHYVPFTVVNQPKDPSNGTAEDQMVMVLELANDADNLAVFNATKYPTGTQAVYFMNGETQIFLSHMYDEEKQKLYAYIGSTVSDAESLNPVSIPAGESQTFYVPMEFTTAGTATFESRVYPMSNEEKMALANGSVNVLGYGMLNMSAVDEDNNPLLVTFAVEGQPTTEPSESYSKKLLEGSYNVTVTSGDTKSVFVMNVRVGEASEKTVRFVKNIPVSITGDGEVYLLAPLENETISLTSANRWNADNPAMYSLNITLGGVGANATISVEMPTIYWQGTLGQTHSSELGAQVFDTITCQANVDGVWEDVSYVISPDNKTLMITPVNPAMMTEISIVLKGRVMGDINGKDGLNIYDARDVAWASVISDYKPTDVEVFYGNVNAKDNITIYDARDIAWRSVGVKDNYYNDV